MAAFDYVKPASLESFINDLAQVRSEGAILAGGTDLLVQIRAGLVSRKVLFDVNNLEEMHGISDQGDSVWIGAAVRIVDVAESSLIQNAIPCLSLATIQLGSPQIRNRATLGSNILRPLHRLVKITTFCNSWNNNLANSSTMSSGVLFRNKKSMKIV